MNKLLPILLSSILLIGCNSNTPNCILGKWHTHYPSINGYGELHYIIDFHDNGTYCSYVNGSKTVSGEYTYSYSTNELKQFNRNEGGYVFEDTVTYKAYLQDDVLYIEAFGKITKYTR